MQCVNDLSARGWLLATIQSLWSCVCDQACLFDCVLSSWHKTMQCGKWMLI